MLWDDGYQPEIPHQVFVLGEEGIRLIKRHVQQTHLTDTLDDYELHLAERLAYVFCGGELSNPQYVTKQYLLDLEHEIVLGLCGDPRTHTMIESTLNKSKK